MQRVFISAVAPSLPPTIVEQLNQRHQTLAKTIEIDIADTGFFLKAGFERVEIIQELTPNSESRLDFLEEREGRVFKVLSTIPVDGFDTVQLFYGYEYAKLEAVKVIIAILERYGLDSRPFRIRAFHIQGDVSRSKIEKTLPPDDSYESRDLQIHFKIEYELFAEPETFEFLAFEFSDTIESMLGENSLGEVEGNEIGGHYFTLFCVGDNPRLMLESVRGYLLESSKDPEDFVLIVDENGREKIWISSLSS